MRPASGEMTRRELYTAAIYGFWSLMGAALATPALVYLLLPPKPRRQEEWIEAGDISRLRPDEPLELVFRQNRTDGWKVTSEKSTVWAVRLADSQVVAFAPQCTHLGCAYHWDEAKKNFVCPCHSSLFSIDGSVLSGPAPRPLDRYPTRVEKGKLLLGAPRPQTA